MCKEN